MTYSMTYSVSDYIDTAGRALNLGCVTPTGIAILPRNFDSAPNRKELVNESSASEIRTLWRLAGLTETRIEPPGERFPVIEEKSAEWLGPTIFVAASLISQNQDVIAVALNVISTYLTEHVFKGLGGSRTAKLEIIVPVEGKKDKKIKFEGPAESIPALCEVIREVSRL